MFLLDFLSHGDIRTDMDTDYALFVTESSRHMVVSSISTSQLSRLNLLVIVSTRNHDQRTKATNKGGSARLEARQFYFAGSRGFSQWRSETAILFARFRSSSCGNVILF